VGGPSRSEEAAIAAYLWRNNLLLTLHNFSERSQTVKFDLGVPEGRRLVNLLAGEDSEADASGKHSIVLGGYGCRWYRLGGFGHILRREKY
jgi:maltose alpha-D-glucosyltransferase/alpha-amylase